MRTDVRTTFGRSDVVSCGRRTGLCTLSKSEQSVGFAAASQALAGVEDLKRIGKDAVFRRRHGTRDMSISRDVRRSGR